METKCIFILTYIMIYNIYGNSRKFVALSNRTFKCIFLFFFLNFCFAFFPYFLKRKSLKKTNKPSPQCVWKKKEIQKTILGMYNVHTNMALICLLIHSATHDEKYIYFHYNNTKIIIKMYGLMWTMLIIKFKNNFYFKLIAAEHVVFVAIL